MSDEKELYKNEPPHQYCDTVNVIGSQEIFLLAMRSGGVLNAFLLTPSHTKRLVLALQDQIKKHEEVYGEIKAALALRPILSPMQPIDRGKEKGE